MGNDVTITGSMGGLPQGDEAFVGILEELGAKVAVGADSISVESPAELKGGSFDLGNTPDLLPPLAVLSLKSSGQIEITNAGHARLKETDRIAAIAREIPKLGVSARESADGVVLRRDGPLRGADLDSQNDHRLFMAFCMAGMFVGDCTVTDPGSVAVSYPDFVSEMNRMGAQISVR